MRNLAVGESGRVVRWLGKSPAARGARTFGLMLFALACRWPAVAGEDPRPAPEEGRLKQIVARLASPEFAGRSGKGGEKAADYLVGRFKELKLAGLFAGDYDQSVPGLNADSPGGRNVGAVFRGQDPALRDEWIILAAHFDHLGVRRGRLYPGADDNASGVAMMLEVARSVVHGPPPKRSIMFIGFDLEEIGLFGSRYFVEHSPVPLDRVKLFITADMIGRSLAGVCPQHVFLIGSEHAPALRDWVKDAKKSPSLTIGTLGADLLLLNRSDYGPFRAKRVPFLFFTTGESPRYHTPDDTPETLDYPKLARISQVIHQVVARALAAPTVPKWQDAPSHPFEEAVAIRDVLVLLARNKDQLKIGTAQLFVINTTLRTLEPILERGAITPDERARVIQQARIVLFTVL